MATTLNKPQQSADSFDLARITKSKSTVDLSSNTIRSYAQRGLRIYKVGRASFFSKSELANFIQQHVTQNGGTAR